MSTKRNSRVAVRLLYSLLISIGALVGMTLIASVIAYCTNDPIALIKPLSIATLIICAAAGAFVNSKLFGMGQANVAALIVALLLFTVGIIAKRGAIGIGPLINYTCYMASSALFAYFAKRMSVEKRRRRIR